MASGCQDRAHAEDGDWLRQQIDRAKNGATIEVPAGRYDISDAYISKDITIIGQEDRSEVHQTASVTDKGILVPTEGTSLRVENLTFLGAHSWDRNGAGVRFEGRTLEIVNCLFDGNEDGILFTGDDNGSLKVMGSEFRNSGFGDGYSHGIYVDGAATLEVAMTIFERTSARFLPVVQIGGEDAPPELLGAVFHVDALRNYNSALAEISRDELS